MARTVSVAVGALAVMMVAVVVAQSFVVPIIEGTCLRDFKAKIETVQVPAEISDWLNKFNFTPEEIDDIDFMDPDKLFQFGYPKETCEQLLADNTKMVTEEMPCLQEINFAINEARELVSSNEKVKGVVVGGMLCRACRIREGQRQTEKDN